MKKKVLVGLFLLIVVLLLVSCSPNADITPGQLQELDKELGVLPDQELNEIIEEGDKDKDALAGMAGMQPVSTASSQKAIGKFYNKMPASTKAALANVPKKIVYERAKQKQIKEVKPPLNICGDGICDSGETADNCPQDCELEPLPDGYCFDTDGGKNTAELGAVKIIGEDESIIYDWCPTTKQVGEGVCAGKGTKLEFIECKEDEICYKGACIKPEEKFICGNGVCENQAEKDSGCTIDCGSGSCKGGIGQCDDNVDVYCICQEEESRIIRANSPCINECDNCGKQEQLFDDFAAMQSQVYSCLVDYFQFKPFSKAKYFVVHDDLKEACNDPDGCLGAETGKFPLTLGGEGVLFDNLPGDQEFGENQPTKNKHLMADKHETVHYFLHQMLHSPPAWLDEAIAIQTNERLVCHPQESQGGDAYLQERQGDTFGIVMSDNTYLNDDFYQRLKNKQTSLSSFEKTGKTGDYIIGTLWIMGLKLDYGCEKECVRDIILKLKEYVDSQCKISQNSCGLTRFFVIEEKKECKQKPDIPGSPSGSIIAEPGLKSEKQKSNSYKDPDFWRIWTRGGSINNIVIKQATDEVVGKDTSALFDLLEIK